MKNCSVFFLACVFSAPLAGQNFSKVITGPLANTPGDSRSVNWIDVNNDGWVDCMISNGPTGGQNNMLYLNNGAGNFTAVLNDTIVKDNKPSDGATWADIDNDGDMDALVVNWYNVNNMLYTNNGSGTFTQVSTGTIVNDAGYSETASWGDYDNDGFVDAYVTNSGGNLKNFLYHNNGDGTFTRILSGAPVTDQHISRCVNWTDMDNDGDVDLFVSNENGQNEDIYRNDGAGVFTPVTGNALVSDGGKTMSSSWADYDNDGDLDVFLANDQGNNALFRNEGNFSFTKLVSDTVSGSGGNSFSSAWSDVDNDGDLDLFVTNSFWTVNRQLNFFYLNNGNGSFTRNSSSILASDSAWSYGCAFADYDNDGLEDLAVATCRFNSTDENDFLYHNEGDSLTLQNHWITVSLAGTTINRSAIGAKVRVHAVINGVPTWQLREISAQSSYCGENDLRAHFGLGNATVIDTLTVEWLNQPVDFFLNVGTDQFITITEGSGISGLPSKKDENAISVFPNPAKNNLTLEWKNHGFAPGDRISISNAAGRLEQEEQVGSATERVQLRLKNNLSSGTYYVSILTKTGRLVRKFVVVN